MSKYENKQQSTEEAIKRLQNLSDEQGVIVMIANDDDMTVLNINISPLQRLNMVECYSDALNEMTDRKINVEGEK